MYSSSLMLAANLRMLAGCRYAPVKTCHLRKT